MPICLCEKALMCYALARSVITMLLLASGDVETIPGAFMGSQIKEIMAALSVLPQLQQGQLTLIAELRNVKTKHKTVDNKFESLSPEINYMEADLATLKALRKDVRAVDIPPKELTKQVSYISVQQYNLENQSRRPNLIFLLCSPLGD